MTVTYTCADPLSGVASCSAPVTVTNDGANQVVTGTAVDTAGNTATVDTTVNVDSTAPSITATVNGSADARGWYSGAVTVHFTCADELSGVDSCPADVTVDTEGAKQSVTRIATDKAGNTAAATATVNIDKSQPVITATVDGAKNPAGWYKGAVTVRYTCSDSLSGVDSCPTDVVVDADSAKHTITRDAKDKAGNSATATTTNIKLDKTAPTVLVKGPVNKGTYTLDKMPAISCETTDALSGVVSKATADTTRGINGAYKATCSGASDLAGSTAGATTVAYTVTPTAASLKELTSVYLTTNGGAGAKGMMTDLGNLLDKGNYCKYLDKVSKEPSAKTPTLTSPQAAELTYWALMLAPKKC